MRLRRMISPQPLRLLRLDHDRDVVVIDHIVVRLLDRVTERSLTGFIFST
jgi:hypothetical protein